MENNYSKAFNTKELVLGEWDVMPLNRLINWLDSYKKYVDKPKTVREKELKKRLKKSITYAQKCQFEILGIWNTTYKTKPNAATKNIFEFFSKE